MNKIVWEAWIDPYHSNAGDFGMSSTDNQDSISETQEPEDAWKGDTKTESLLGINFKKVVGTPYGLLSITEDTLVSSKFEFWIMHTNFDLTPQIIQKIESIPGVETLEVYTRYRVRIGFPKSGLFSTTITKYAIEMLVQELNIEKIQGILRNIEQEFDSIKMSEFQDIYSKISTKDKWSVYICPNGSMDILVADPNQHETYQNKLLVLNDTHIMAGGILINSDEI